MSFFHWSMSFFWPHSSFFSLGNLTIKVVNCPSKCGRLGRSSFLFPDRFLPHCPEVVFLVLFADVFTVNWGLLTWALASGFPLLFSIILLYVSQHRSMIAIGRKEASSRSLVMTAIGQKKASSHSLVFTRDTRNKYRKKSSGQTHLFNIVTIGAKDRNLGSSWAYCAAFP